MKKFGEYEIEYLDQTDTEPEPARGHPDPAEAAWIYHYCRDHNSRRFAFCLPWRDRKGADTQFGIQHSNGRVTMLTPTGTLIGDYSCVDSAMERLSRGSEPWLVWLDPKPPMDSRPRADAVGNARQELKRNSPREWTVSFTFTAHGPHGARVIGMDVAQAFAETLPGFRRDAVAVYCEDNPSVVTKIFCDRHQSCLLPPRHFAPCRGEDDAPLTDYDTDGDPT